MVDRRQGHPLRGHVHVHDALHIAHFPVGRGDGEAIPGAGDQQDETQRGRRCAQRRPPDEGVRAADHQEERRGEECVGHVGRALILEDAGKQHEA